MPTEDDPTTVWAMDFMRVMQTDAELARRLCVFLESRRQEVIAADDFDAKFLESIHVVNF